MHIILADINPEKFYPLSLTRPVGELRAGILTISEKWIKHGFSVSGYLVREALQEKWEATIQADLILNSSIVPLEDLIVRIKNLKPGQVLMKDEKFIAFRPEQNSTLDWKSASLDWKSARQAVQYKGKLLQLSSWRDIFLEADELIRLDFQLLTHNRKSQALANTNLLIGPSESLFIEEGAQVHGATLNTSSGPIYIASNAEVMEGSLVRGPFSLGESAILKMGAKIYGPSVIGPHSKVGGEVSNSIISAYSNKGHDGFLGNSVIGEWCNLGADTNTSNLKNNYGEVNVWDYSKKDYVNSGLTFCGLVMGDHSKCSINSMFNTGTTIGVFANVFGDGFPPKFIPSFSWGGNQGFSLYDLDKAFEVADRVCARRGVKFSDEDRAILKNVLTETAEFRK